MSVLLLRRRVMMQQIGHRYNVDWYPIVQGPVTLKDMIAELGDLMQTYDDAPDRFNNRQKTSAFALRKSLTSVQFGGNFAPNCIVYEEGQAPIRITSGTRIINFTSTETYKHVVCYGRSFGGNQSLSGIMWWINTSGWENATVVALGVKYLHIAYGTNAAPWIGDLYNPNPRGYAGSVYYIPDWWHGWMQILRFKQCSKIRFSKGVSMSNSIYFWGNTASELPNLTDIYVHWGLGEVPQQPGTRFTGQWKLHIPDLGNAEDNAALVAEYRSKGWNYVAGKGIFNDVEIAEPKEILI